MTRDDPASSASYRYEPDGSGVLFEAAALKLKSPAMLVGIDTKNTFKGTWGTGSYWHETYQKNILAIRGSPEPLRWIS